MNFQTNGGQKVALTFNRLLKKLREYGTVNRLTGSSRSESAAVKNVDLVNDLVWSQEDTLQTHRMVPEISCVTDIWLRCQEITIMSLVVAFYWNRVQYAKNATNLNKFMFIEVCSNTF